LHEEQLSLTEGSTTSELLVLFGDFSEDLQFSQVVERRTVVSLSTKMPESSVFLRARSSKENISSSCDRERKSEKEKRRG